MDSPLMMVTNQHQKISILPIFVMSFILTLVSKRINQGAGVVFAAIIPSPCYKRKLSSITIQSPTPSPSLKSFSTGSPSNGSAKASLMPSMRVSRLQRRQTHAWLVSLCVLVFGFC